MNPAVHPDLEVMVVVVAGGIFSINFYYITTDPFIYGHISHNPSSSSSLGGPFYLSVGWSSAVPPPTHQASQGWWVVVVMGSTALIMVAMKLFFIISSSVSISWRSKGKGLS